MKKPKWSSSSKPQHGDFPLQITSLADVFTILLVFLLKSFATSAALFQPTAGLAIPTVTGSANALTESLRVEVTEKSLLVEGEPVSSSEALKTAFSKARQRQEFLKGKTQAVELDNKLLIVADKGLSYERLKPVLSAAAESGFSDFKIVVAGDAG